MTHPFPVPFSAGIEARKNRDVDHQPTVFSPVDHFVLQRLLGYKSLLPGSGQWYESSNSGVGNISHPKNKCWVCEGH
jgi:hypothetical protein